VLEHIGRWDVQTVLKRWFDLLKSDGKLILSVPDFEAITKYYVKTKDLKSLVGLLYGGQDYNENFHKICWDFETLSEDLKQVGFQDVVRYDWKTSGFSNFDDYSKSYLPHLDFNEGTLMSLNVQAVKK